MVAALKEGKFAKCMDKNKYHNANLEWKNDFCEFFARLNKSGEVVIKLYKYFTCNVD